MCWRAETSAPGLDKPCEYLPLQAVITNQSRLKTGCSLGQTDGETGRQPRGRLINKSESRGPILLGILSSFTGALVKASPGCLKGSAGWNVKVRGLVISTTTWRPRVALLLSTHLIYIFWKTWRKKKIKQVIDFAGEEGGRVNLQHKAFVQLDSHVLGGGRPTGTHYTPLASAKAVTLTNSQSHNSTVVRFVFSLNPLYTADTKAAGPDLSNVPQQRPCTKLHFLSFMRKRKGQSCCFIFLKSPPNQADWFCFLFFFDGGVAPQCMTKT